MARIACDVVLFGVGVRFERACIVGRVAEIVERD
jgi:hypothetical protein